jgi:hypothetical protein
MFPVNYMSPLDIITTTVIQNFNKNLQRACPLTDSSHCVCIEQKIGLREIWLHSTAEQDYQALTGKFIMISQ